MLQFWVLVAMLALGKLDITSTSFMRLRSVMMVWIFWGTCVRHRCRVVLVPRESVSWVFTRHMCECRIQNNNNTTWRGSVFYRRGASTPLWGVESCALPSGRPNPIPAIPLCVVRTPHLHGAPTTEETVEL